MAESTITVTHLSKRYRLGEIQPYLSLRDSLMRFLNPWQWTRSTKKRDDFFALQDINFSVGVGEVVGLIGRNGAGKSTLLKILSQITLPTHGTITLNGRVASLLEVGTGFHPELTGRENIFLNGAILGMTKQEIKRKFDEIVDFAEIEKFLDTPVKRYSSGMYVRLAFAVAAHLEPEILLVDEVLAVGDVAFQKKCLGKMDDVVNQGGRTIVFVSHNMSAIQRLCPRTILLAKSRLVADGATDKVIEQYLEETANASSHIQIHDRTDRRGSGRIRINQVILQDAHGKPINYFSTGQDIQLAIEYRKESKSLGLRNVKVAIGINNHLGERIVLLYNDMANDAFTTVPDQGTFLVSVPHLPLIPGHYYFSCFVESNNEIADWIIDVSSFEVHTGDYFGTRKLPPTSNQGNVLIPHSWQVY